MIYLGNVRVGPLTDHLLLRVPGEVLLPPPGMAKLKLERFATCTNNKEQGLQTVHIWDRSQDRSAKLLHYLANSHYVLIQYVSIGSFSRKV